MKVDELSKRPIITKVLSDARLANTAIFFYAALIFIDAFPHLHSKFETSINTLIWSLSAFFVIEVFARIRCYGLKKYFSTFGNTADFLVVIVGFIAVSLPFLNLINIGILRLARLFKLLRMFKFIPHAEIVYTNIGRALRASGAIFFLLFLMMFVFALLGNAMFSSMLPQYFGDPVSSIYSIFTVFSIENWNDIPDEAMQTGIESAWLIRAFFIFVLISGGFIGLSLANAVFVDEMVRDNHDELERKVDLLIELNKKQALTIQSLMVEK
ncbi:MULTISPECIES: ion transporter [unclassified Shewanella]|uniref:ion transporter n=1 Tax=unclassified Shewanella TaxID=196818 RepID=UPI001C7DE789|nr:MULTISPECIES: ion transporter [unclassified Shewanella]